MSKPHDINIGFELRPCIVGGVKALFHRWVDDEKRAAKLRVPATFALVEYEIGALGLAPLKSVRFLDSLNKFAGIDFGEGEGDAVPVVRCRDCIRRKTLRNGSHVCPYSTVDLDLDGFCHRGKRKDDVNGCK